MAVGSKSVHEAILAVTESIGPISRGVPVAGIGGGRDYNVIGIDQIIAAIQPLLVRESLTIIPQVQSAKSWDLDMTDREGTVIGRQHWAQVIVAYELTGPDGSHVTSIVVGESENNNDKSMSAAMSMAEKYFYKQTFKIVTGDADPDTQGTKVVGITPERPAQQTNQQQQREQTPRQQPAATPAAAEKIAATAGATKPSGALVSKPQAQLIWAVAIKNIGMDETGMRDFVDEVIGRHIEANDELTVSEFNKVKARLEQHPGYTEKTRR